MQIFEITDECLIRLNHPSAINFKVEQGNHLFIYSVEEWRKFSFSHVSERTVIECETPGFSKHEQYDGYDFIALNLLNEQAPYSSMGRMGVYIFSTSLIFVSSQPVETLQDVIVTFSQKQAVKLTNDRILFAFFDKLTSKNSERLALFEDEIAELEEQIMENVDENYTKSIIDLRKRLMFLKKYYEQLYDVAVNLEENESGLLDNRFIRYFKMITDRLSRLNHNIQNLRDYITQVREAYQSQVDISLNKVMKIFTVVTSIFLPLTLIAGWYGMNFGNIPELKWQYGYLYAIGLSIASVIISILYFKRKKLL